MPSLRVATELNAGTYYLTLTVQRWYYLFDRFNRWQLLADSLRYCQENKSLQLNGYVFMLNHIHLIVTSPDVAGFLRDFKRLPPNSCTTTCNTMNPAFWRCLLIRKGRIGFGRKPTPQRKSKIRRFICKS